MGTVSSWARDQGYDYRFLGDEFFDCLPGWYRDACRGHKWPMSDLARLLTAKNLLSSGYSHAMWFDADLVIFNAKRFNPTISGEFAFCREVWMEQHENPIRKALHQPRDVLRLFKATWRGYFTLMHVNNASFYITNCWFLDHYINSILYSGRRLPLLRPQHMGTDLLTMYHSVLHFPLIRHVGAFSSFVIGSIANGNERIIRAYTRHAGEPLYAANLCGSQDIGQHRYEAVIENLIATGGDLFNRHVPVKTPGA